MWILRALLIRLCIMPGLKYHDYRADKYWARKKRKKPIPKELQKSNTETIPDSHPRKKLHTNEPCDPNNLKQHILYTSFKLNDKIEAN